MSTGTSASAPPDRDGLGVIQYRFGSKYLPRGVQGRSAQVDAGERRRAVRHLTLAIAFAAAVGIAFALLQRGAIRISRCRASRARPAW